MIFKNANRGFALPEILVSTALFTLFLSASLKLFMTSKLLQLEGMKAKTHYIVSEQASLYLKQQSELAPLATHSVRLPILGGNSADVRAVPMVENETVNGIQYYEITIVENERVVYTKTTAIGRKTDARWRDIDYINHVIANEPLYAEL